MGVVFVFLAFWLLHGPLLCMAKVRYYDFVLKETNFTRLCYTKSMLTVNGSFPGPTIRAQKGDTVFVTVHNQGLYGVTIHWHGVKQPRNPWSDGPENVTQCPIKRGSSFTQEINLSDEEGTLWWHAHSDWSRATVHGAIIIKPSSGSKYPYPKPDGEKTLIIASWFNGDVMAIYKDAIESGQEFNQSNAFTINGHPGHLYRPNCSTATTSRVYVTYGKTYLLRVINSNMNEELFFAIANHNVTVVGTDGAYLKNISTAYIAIGPGQTMDLLLKADQTPSHYYIAASPLFNGVGPFDNTTTSAIIQYSGNYTRPSFPYYPDALPFYNDTDAAEGFTKQMKSFASGDHPVNVPQNITTRIYITITTATYNNRLAANLNNISFVAPNISVLEAYYRHINGVFTEDFPKEPLVYYNFTGDDLPSDLQIMGNGTKVVVVNYNDSVEIVFQGTNVGGTAENHPMHLHGYSFYMVGTGPGNFDNVTDPKYYNLVDPPEQNTISVPKKGWAAIRFVANNPGVWFMHCHFERHSSWGMDTVLIVKNGGTTDTSIRPPPTDMPPCA